MPHRVVVIGGGICGASAALQLSRDGHDVLLLERGPCLGGLVVSLEIGGTPIECFYHHVFPREREIIGLINELGLGARFELLPSSVGIFADGRMWPFTGPLDLLRFGPLPLSSRIRTGLYSFRYTLKPHSEDLDDITAHDWLERGTGRHATEVIWDNLLRFKFGSGAADAPASWMWARFRQRATARGLRGERLGYLRGGFRQLFQALEGELARLGAVVRTSSTVDCIALDRDRVVGVVVDGEPIETDAVVYAGQLPGLTRLVPAGAADERWTGTGALGAMCVVVELRRAVSDIYWTNICDDLPFGALIEHTNLVPPGDYGGRHIAYLGTYFTQEDPIASADTADVAREWVGALTERFDLEQADICDIHPFRTPYAAPLVHVGYRKNIPPVTSHLAGLIVATTAQIYPEDRGMSQGVRLGRIAARAAGSSSTEPA